MVFTPKFVDLVKDYTTVQGTGPVSLAQEVVGFTSFASACAAGDQFYYCIQGIDKPAEREVGRGEMLGDGTIGRDPIGGVPTDFTKGRKSIALIAAAEWMEQVQAAMMSQRPAAGDRLFIEMDGAGVPASQSTIDTAGFDVAGVGCARYVADAAVDAAFVTANPRIAFMTADGRGFRLDHGQRLTIEMAGGRGNDNGPAERGVDNLPALQALTNWRPKAGLNVAVDIHFGVGTYWFSDTIEPRCVFRLKGAGGIRAGSALGQQSATVLRVASDRDIVRIHGGTTLGATGVSGSNLGGANRSWIEDLQLFHDGALTDENACGIRARGTFNLRNVSVVSAGDGVHCNCLSGSGGATEGEANEWFVQNLEVYSEKGHGFYIKNGDANAGCAIGLSIHGAGKCGIFDQSWFTNSYTGVHLAGWGNKGVFHAGANWQLIVESAVGIAPGEGATWTKLSNAAAASAAFPAYDNAATYKAQSPILATGSKVFSGVYIELVGGLKAHVPDGTIIAGTVAVTDRSNVQNIDPTIGATFRRGVGMFRGAGGDANWPASATVGGSEQVIIGGPDSGQGEDGFRKIVEYRNEYDWVQWRWRNSGRHYLESNGRTLIEYSGSRSDLDFGRSSTVPNVMALSPFALAPSLDGTLAGYAGSARIHYGIINGAPTAGEHAKREFAWNLDDGQTGVIGWACVVAGTPGKHYPATLFSPIKTQAATAYSFTFGDGGYYTRFTAATAVTATIAAEATEPLPVGSIIEIEQAGTGVVTIAGAQGVTISSRGGKVALAGQYAVAALKKVAADSWTLTGDLA